MHTKKTNLMPRSLTILFAVSLTFVILYGSFASVFHSPLTYNTIPATLQEENLAVLGYLAGENAIPGFLDNREQAHMHDVRTRLFAAFLIYLVSLGIIVGMFAVLLWKRQWLQLEELLERGLIGAGIAVLSLVCLAGLAALLSFERFWVVFHVFFFPSGNWMFPADSTLIRLYPATFFQSFGMRWGFRLLFAGMLSVIVGIAMRLTNHAGKAFKR